ncbi:Gfo/Idh/MocA family oxidoreductase [Candidatus Sumerlaeota bacterium]|nr:Gfo/Idh/MocA family oxidoreductase [Candidatus Sumerlaeota bacterium]
MTERKINRRYFFGTAAGASAALTGAAMAGAGKPRKAPKARRAVAANEKILMGLIGAGGRGAGVMKIFMNVDPAVEFIATCDVGEKRRLNAARIAGGKAKALVDHRELLDIKEINAVLIASPTHWHAQHLMDAIAAGKDVYLEKPMSYSIEQGVEMVKAVRKTDRIVQIGMQRRSSPMVQEARKLMEDGILGKVNIVRAQWFWHRPALDLNAEYDGAIDWERFLGSAPKRPFQAIRALQWRYFWDYEGGIVTDQGTHLMDVVQWLTGKGTARSAVMQGGSYQMNYETPDTFCAALEYEDFTVSWMGTYTNCFENGWQIVFQGDRGTMIVNDEGVRVYAEPWTNEANQKPYKEMKGGISADAHVEDFLECLRSRKEPNAPVEVGHTAVSGPHLCNVAYRNKAVAKLDENCTKVTV